MNHLPATPEVEAVGRIMRFDGGYNINFDSWYQHLKYDDGKAHLPAITILQDILGWYRPVEIRDEVSGEFLGFGRRFDGEYLQRSLPQLESRFNLSKQQVRDALALLEGKGLIKIHIEPVVRREGRKPMSNVRYIQIFPEAIALISGNVFSGTDGQVFSRTRTKCDAEHTYTNTTYTKTSSSKSERDTSCRGGEHQQKKIDRTWLNALYKAGLYNGKREAVARQAMSEGLGLEDTLEIVEEVFSLKEMYPPPSLSDPRAAAASALAETPSLKGLVESERKAAKRRKQQQAPRVKTNEEVYGKDRIFV